MLYLALRMATMAIVDGYPMRFPAIYLLAVIALFPRIWVDALWAASGWPCAFTDSA